MSTNRRTTLALSLGLSLAGLLAGAAPEAQSASADASKLRGVTYNVGTRTTRVDAAVPRHLGDLRPRIDRPSSRPFGAFDADEGPTPSKVFGGDDREPIFEVEDYPWSATAKVFSRFPDGVWLEGTAILIGPDDALTAAHVVHDRSHGGWAEIVEVIPGYDFGFMPFGLAEAEDIRSFAGWTEDEDFAYDVALLDLDFDIGDDAGYLGLGARSRFDLFNAVLNTAGYPTDLDNGEGMWFASDFATAVDDVSIQLAGLLDAANGQSGSGIWMREGDDRLVVGVLSHETSTANVAVRITDEIFDTLDAWLDGFDGPTDLLVSAVATDLPQNVAAGASGFVDFEIDNFGSFDVTVTAEALAQDLGGARTVIGSADVFVRAGEYVNIGIPVSIPASLGSGTYTLMGAANRYGDVPEVDLSDNVARGPAITLGSSGSLWEPLNIGKRVKGRLAANGEHRYRFVLDEQLQELRFKLRGRRFGGFALVVRPDGTNFRVAPRAPGKTIEYQPQMGEWLVVVKNRPDATHSRKYRFKVSKRARDR